MANRIVRLTEADITRLVRRVINEDEELMGANGIKPEHLKVIMTMASRAFPTVKEFQRHPFQKFDKGGDSPLTYFGEFNQQNTPNLKKNQNVPYEGIVSATVTFFIYKTGPDAGIYGEVRLNSFVWKKKITADEINKIPVDKLWDSFVPNSPDRLISDLSNQYIGIQNGVGKMELMERLKQDGFKKN
jgi:hypothetical protein